MPVYYPQPGYSQPIYTRNRYPQAGWPSTALPFPVPTQGTSAGPAMHGGILENEEQSALLIPPVMAQSMMPAMGFASTGFAPYSMAPADNTPASPGLEEAKYVRLAAYYKNPYYGVKAELARKKSEKKLDADKKIIERKVLVEWARHIKEEQSKLEKLRDVLAKRKKYWGRMAGGEGVDPMTITQEQQTLVEQSYQLDRHLAGLAENKSTLRSRQRIAGVQYSDSEDEALEPWSSGSQSSSSDMFAGPKELEAVRRKIEERDKRKGKGRAERRKHRGRKHQRSRSRDSNRKSSTPLEMNGTFDPDIHENVHTLSLHTKSLPPSRKRSSTQINPSSSSAPVEQETVAAVDRTLPLTSEVTATHVPPSQPVRKDNMVLKSHSGQLESSNNDHPKKPHNPTLIQVLFPRKVVYYLTKQQIEYDFPNAFSQVLQECQHKIKPGKKLRVPISGRKPQAFSLIQDYLNGNNILPLSSAHCLLLAGASDAKERAHEHLLQEAQFYGLENLKTALQPFVTPYSSRRLTDDAQCASFSKPLHEKVLLASQKSFVQRSTPDVLEYGLRASFLVFDLNQNNRPIVLEDLEHIVASNSSRRRLTKTEPRFRVIAAGSAVKSGDSLQPEHFNCADYSILLCVLSALGQAFGRRMGRSLSYSNIA